jgi:chromosome segregation ATPase
MIEWMMFFGGGFLAAALLAIMLLSVIHQRAVRLTRRRFEDAIPLSMVELQAHKDRLRADFAISTRRLEATVEQLRFKAATQLGEIGQKFQAIGRLKSELAKTFAVVDELTAKVAALNGKIEETERERERSAVEALSTRGALCAKAAELVQSEAERRLAADRHGIEVATLTGQIAQHKLQIDRLQRHADDIARQRAEDSAATLAVTSALEEKHQAVAALGLQVVALQHESAAKTREIEARAARIADLEKTLAKRARSLLQRDAEMKLLFRAITNLKPGGAPGIHLGHREMPPGLLRSGAMPHQRA